MNLKKINIYSDTSAYVIGTLSALAFFAWQYPALSPGWRFFGMSVISLASGIALQVLLLMFNEWRSARIDKNRALSMCRAICIDEESTDRSDTAKLWRYMIARYSNDSLSNRLSDLIWILITPLSIMVNIGITIWYFGMLTYFVWDGYFSEPFLLFAPLLWRVIFTVFELFICFICNILFNRYPGEARRFNKNYDKLRKTDALLSSKEFRDSIHS